MLVFYIRYGKSLMKFNCQKKDLNIRKMKKHPPSPGSAGINNFINSTRKICLIREDILIESCNMNTLQLQFTLT